MRVRTSDRDQLALVVLLFAAAGVAWWSSADRMAGMDAGPGTDLGGFGWFLGIWTVMMGAMMLPSLAPTAALYARRIRRRALPNGALFASGYLLAWGAAGAVAYGLFRLGRDLFGSELAWHAGGRWAAGAVLVLAALYELTPVKQACLMHCRNPRPSRAEAGLVSGVRHAGWCVGCCAGLMAALFALGVMSLTWMGVVAGLIALEKILPWRRAATWVTATLLLALAVGVLAVPGDVPGLVIPHSPHATQSMRAMHAMS